MGIIYNGITSQSKKINMRLASWQALPPLRNAYVTVPGKHGITDFGCTATEKNITVLCNVCPQRSFDDLVNVLDDVAEWLNPMNGLKQLVFDDVPGRYYMARLSDTINCERLIRSAGAFTLTFVCPDPYAYALSDEAFVISTMGKHEVVRTKGNANSLPIYYFRGDMPGNVLSRMDILTNGVRMRVTGTLYPEETLIIDSGKVTAKVVNTQGETLRNGLMHLVDFDFPTLKKGNNNIEVRVDSYAPLKSEFIELKIQAMSRWG